MTTTSESRFDPNAFLSPLLDAVDQAVIATEPDGRISYWNRAAEAMFGWPAFDVLGKAIFEVTVPGEASGEAMAILERVARGESWTGEFPVRRRDGTPFTARVALSPLRDARGAIVGTVGVSSDVSERVRLEQQIQSVADAVPALISYIEPDGTYRLVNRAYEVWFQRERESMTGKHISEVLGPAAYEVVRPHLERREAVRFEADVPYRDGGPRGVEVSYSPEFDDAGKVRGVVVHVHDISVRRRIEARLRDEVDVVETLYRLGTMLAAELDLERVVQAVTDETTRLSEAKFGAFFYNVLDDRGESYMLYSLSGVPREAFSKFPMPRNTAIFDPTFRAQGVMRLDDVTQDPRYGKSPPHHGMPAGHLPVKSYLAVPVISRSGEVLGGLFFGHPDPGVFTARHERLVTGVAAQAAIAIDNARLIDGVRRGEARYREIAETLRAEDQRKDEFLATLAHELRNPLAPIRSGLEVLRMPNAGPEEQAQARGIMERQVGQMVRLIDDLLDLSRITRNRLELKREWVELGAVIRNAIETTQPALAARGHEVEVELPADRVLLHADPVRLAQVFANLLHNATKFTERGGRVSIAGRVLPEAIEVEVRDTGVGIAPELLPKIFDMFAQGRPDAQGGTTAGLGIGLTLVRRLVELHGGTVDARSEGAGRGSAFVVRVPRETPPPTTGADTAAPGVATSPNVRRVLVADDNQDAALSLAMLLRHEGHDVRTTADGAAALDEALRFLPDVAFIDLGMPILDGLEVARRIRERLGRAPVLVAITGWGREEDRRLALEAGFDHHLTKPATLDAVLAAVAGAGAGGSAAG